MDGFALLLTHTILPPDLIHSPPTLVERDASQPQFSFLLGINKTDPDTLPSPSMLLTATTATTFKNPTAHPSMDQNSIIVSEPTPPHHTSTSSLPSHIISSYHRAAIFVYPPDITKIVPAIDPSPTPIFLQAWTQKMFLVLNQAVHQLPN